MGNRLLFVRMVLSSGIVLAGASAASAGFFEDLGDALNKAGEGISDVARDVKDGVKDALEKKPSPPSPGSEQSSDITWNQAERAESAAGSANEPGFFRTAPASGSSAPKGGSAKGEGARLVGGPRPSPYASASRGDDAPPPRAAPPRRGVERVASLAPLPGFTESTTQPAPPRYAPAVKGAVVVRKPLPASSPSAVSAAVSSPAPPPSPVPQTVVPAAVVVPVVALRIPDRYTVSFADRRVTLADKDDAGASAQMQGLKALADAVAAQARQPNQRVTLVAEASAPDGATGPARLRAFARAQRVQAVLVKAGVRATQVDLKLAVARSDTVRLEIYTDTDTP